MQADPSDQRSLLDLAALDTQVAQLGHRRRTLPEHGEITTLRGRHQAVSEDLVAAETRLSDADALVKRVEGDLNPARERLSRNQTRVESGQIGDPKALKGMLDEIEHLKGRIGDLEDQELEHLQTVEDLTTERDRLALERADITKQARDLIARRDEKLKALDAELATASEARAELAGRLPAELVAVYDRVAARVGGVGAAELRAKRCSGCQLEVNAADLRRFAAAGPTEVLRCEECDRILVRTSESGLG